MALAIVIIGLPALLVGCLIVATFMPPSSADGQFRADFGIGLPPSARQLHGVHVPMAFMDTATHYELHVPPADLPGWLASVRAAARSRGWDDKVSESLSSMMSPPPWWTPDADLDLLKLTVANTSPGGHGITVYYSLSSGRAFVFWWST